MRILRIWIFSQQTSYINHMILHKGTWTHVTNSEVSEDKEQKNQVAFTSHRMNLVTRLVKEHSFGNQRVSAPGMSAPEHPHDLEAAILMVESTSTGGSVPSPPLQLSKWLEKWTRSALEGKIGTKQELLCISFSLLRSNPVVALGLRPLQGQSKLAM